MKLQPDRLEGVNLVTRLEGQRLWVHQTPFEHSVLVPHRGEVLPWPVNRHEDLQAEHFEHLLQLAPELVIFGSGARLRFARPALLARLIEARIGIETMDTAAACRTFNVLASEGRAVAGAFLIERDSL